MKNLFIKELDYLQFHIGKNIDINSIIEIRTLKVLFYSKLDFIKNKLPYILHFVSNDSIGFKNGIKDDFITFYSLRTSKSKDVFLVGISIEYFKDGTKKEEKIYYDKISKLSYGILKSKHDIVLTPME